MTHRWNQTITITEELARELIETQHQFPVHSIVKMEEGWDNIAYLVNESIVFRFPRREFGLDCMANEIALLPLIAQQVSFPLSAPKWIGQACEKFPYPYAGYPLLSGISVTEATDQLIDKISFAQTLASWLKELHAITVMPEHEGLLKGTVDWRLDFSHRGSRFHQHLPQYQTHFEDAGFDAHELLDACCKLEEWEFTSHIKRFLHADLYHRHVLVEPEHLNPTGLIDWGDCQIGHPGIDLAVGFMLTPSAYEQFLSTYGEIDDQMMKIALFNAFFGATSFLPYAFERKVPCFKHWAVLTLNRVMEELQKH